MNVLRKVVIVVAMCVHLVILTWLAVLTAAVTKEELKRRFSHK